MMLINPVCNSCRRPGTRSQGPGFYAEVMEKEFYVSILASRRNGTLYIGVTNDLVRRVLEHREGAVDGFTKRCDVKMLVYFEQCADARTAIQREKNDEVLATAVEAQPN
jgi:putative endonuclease